MPETFVTYEAFGAVGDGHTDDMAAIAAAHAYANEHGLPVRARDGATYYIGGQDITAVVKTDTDFGRAKFVIDDTSMTRYQQQIFSVESDAVRYTPAITTLSRGQRHVDFPHEGRTYVRVFNQSHKIFIRKGLNANAGTDQTDCFLVDADGNIETDIDWDYTEITRAFAKSVEDTPITLRGGLFETIANRMPSKYTYVGRGFHITRSNVTVENLTHIVSGEQDHGAPYNGFLSVIECADVTLRDCLLTPHFTYPTESKEPGKMVSMGTYDLNFNASIGTRLIRIRQTIDIMDRRYWGLMGSNFCKDFYMEGCEMSRFDAHMGVTNATVKGCRLGHMCLNLIGHGQFLLEDSDIFGWCLICLRSDYGSLFDGEVTVRNTVWHPAPWQQPLQIISARNSGDHDFGYTACMPARITIDGLRIADSQTDHPDSPLYVLPVYDDEYTPGKPYAYVTPQELILRGIVTDSGKAYDVAAHPEQYPNLAVTEL